TGPATRRAPAAATRARPVPTRASASWNCSSAPWSRCSCNCRPPRLATFPSSCPNPCSSRMSNPPGESAMVEPRLLTESDVNAALHLSTQAKWNQVDADWRRLLRLWPDSCFGLWQDESLIATATLARFGEIGWVGMLL